MPPEDINEEVNMLNKAVFGDRENPKAYPGIIADQMRMSLEQARTNEILLDLRDSVLKINWMIISAFVIALIALVYKGVSGQ